MSKITVLFTASIFLIAVSCSYRQQNTPPISSLPGSGTFPFTPTKAGTPIPASSSTTTTIVSVSTGTFTTTPTPAGTLGPTSSITATPMITFTSGTDISENALIAFEGVLTIEVVPAAGGTPVVVIEYVTGVGYYESPSWSPAGDRIAFSFDNMSGPRLYVINRDGSGLHILRDNVRYGRPSWSPDGESIAYDTDQGIYITDADGVTLRHIQESPWLEFPTWSPDGKKLALVGSSTSYYAPYNIYLVDSDGKNLHTVTDAIAADSRLSWSPDGKEIAFSSYKGCGDINVLNLATGMITNLTNTMSLTEIDPAWSPDGNYIAYSRDYSASCAQNGVPASGGSGLFIMRADGQGEKRLTEYGSQPSWWPTVLLRQDWRYTITPAGSNLNVRETYSASARSLTKLKQGAIFTALEGPVSEDAYNWWRVRTEDGIEGWIVDVPGWYMFESAP